MNYSTQQYKYKYNESDFEDKALNLIFRVAGIIGVGMWVKFSIEYMGLI